jgi:hypothetical protein
MSHVFYDNTNHTKTVPEQKLEGRPDTRGKDLCSLFVGRGGSAIRIT